MSYTIGIDCRLAGRQHAGIGRYIQNLITRLPQLTTDVKWVFFFSDEQQAQEIEKSKNIKCVYVPIRHYTVKEQLLLPQIFSSEKLDLLHVPHFNIALGYQGKTIVTIHDLLWHEYKGPEVTTLPTWQYWLKHKVYTWIVQQAVHRAKIVLVPAHTIRQTILRFYPHIASKIKVTPEGVDQEFSTAKKSVGTQKIKKQIVYVGSLYPHKNISIVLQALQQLPEYSLMIVGTRNVFQDQVRKQVAELGIAQQVQFLGFVPGDRLSTLLHESSALVQPSLSEGFGLTGVEAMAAGVPVIASDIPVFKEVYGEVPIYFDPRNADSFVAAVRKLEKADRKKLIQSGQKWVKQYSWDTMAKETLAAYTQVLHEKR